MYKKPIVTVDAGLAEGVYAASGAAKGTLNVTYPFASTASNPLTIGIHLNHGTSIDDLKMTGFTYSVN